MCVCVCVLCLVLEEIEGTVLRSTGCLKERESILYNDVSSVV